MQQRALANFQHTWPGAGPTTAAACSLLPVGPMPHACAIVAAARQPACSSADARLKPSSRPATLQLPRRPYGASTTQPSLAAASVARGRGPTARLALVPPALQVNGRYIKKRIHVRIEHVTPSRCHEEFLRRCKENDAARHEAKVAGTAPPVLKRQPKGPRTEGFTLENVKMETITREPWGPPPSAGACARPRHNLGCICRMQLGLPAACACADRRRCYFAPG